MAELNLDRIITVFFQESTFHQHLPNAFILNSHLNITMNYFLNYIQLPESNQSSLIYALIHYQK